MSEAKPLTADVLEKLDEFQRTLEAKQPHEPLPLLLKSLLATVRDRDAKLADAMKMLCTTKDGRLAEQIELRLARLRGGTR